MPLIINNAVVVGNAREGILAPGGGDDAVGVEKDVQAQALVYVRAQPHHLQRQHVLNQPHRIALMGGVICAPITTCDLGCLLD